MSTGTQHLESRHARLGRWAAAALVVCALHAAAVALALRQPPEPDEDDDIAGAMTVELAPLPAPAPVDTPDVAVGKEVKEYAPPVPEASKKVEQKVEEDIPPVEPTPAPEPEIALPKPQPKEKEEVKEEAQDVQAQPPREAKDDMSTAPQRVEAPPAPKAAASAGQAAAAAQITANWQRAVSKHIARFKQIPETARRLGLRGSANVSFVVDRASGQVVRMWILKSSGVPAVDEEIMAIFKRASPYPRPPREVTDEWLELHQVFSFTVR